MAYGGEWVYETCLHSLEEGLVRRVITQLRVDACEGKEEANGPVPCAWGELARGMCGKWQFEREFEREFETAV